MVKKILINWCVVLLLSFISTLKVQGQTEGQIQKLINEARTHGSANRDDYRPNSTSDNRSSQRDEEIRAQYAEVHKQAYDAWNRGDYVEALNLLYKQKKLRDGPNVRKDIAILETYFAAKKEEEDRKKREEKEHQNAPIKMQQSIDSYLQSLNENQTTLNGLQFGDPNVVDARRLPSGLLKSTENAIDIAYMNAPPGVKERVSRGFQAVEKKDWKLANAWFKDALKFDKNNKNLKIFVMLTIYSFENREPQKTLNSQEPDPYLIMDPTNQKEIDDYFKEIQQEIYPWPAPEKIRNYIKSISVETFTNRYNLIMADEDDIQFLFNGVENKGNLTAPFETKDFENIMLNGLLENMNHLIKPSRNSSGNSNPK